MEQYRRRCRFCCQLYETTRLENRRQNDCSRQSDNYARFKSHHYEIEKINAELADLQLKMQEAMNKKLAVHEKILASQGLELADLQKRVASLEAYRDAAIKADLLNGMKGKDAARKYGLSQGRISQIKNSDKKQ